MVRLTHAPAGRRLANLVRQLQWPERKLRQLEKQYGTLILDRRGLGRVYTWFRGRPTESV